MTGWAWSFSTSLIEVEDPNGYCWTIEIEGIDMPYRQSLVDPGSDGEVHFGRISFLDHGDMVTSERPLSDLPAALVKEITDALLDPRNHERDVDD